MEFIFPSDSEHNEPISENNETMGVDKQELYCEEPAAYHITSSASEPSIRALEGLQSLSTTISKTISSIRGRKDDNSPPTLSFAEASIVLLYYQIGKTDMRRVNLGLYTIYVFMASSWVNNKLEFGFDYNNKVYTLDEASLEPNLAKSIRKTLPAEKFLFRFIGAFDTATECAFANAIRASPGLVQYPKGFYSLISIFADPGINKCLIDEAISYQYEILDGLVARGAMQRKRRFFSTSYQFSPTIIPVLTCLALHVRDIMLSNFSSDKRDNNNDEIRKLDCNIYKLAALYSAFSVSKLPLDYDSSFQIPRTNKAKLSNRVRMLAGMIIHIWSSPTLTLQPENVDARDIVGSTMLSEAMALGIRVSNGVL